MPSFRVGYREFTSQEVFVNEGRRCGTPELNAFQKERIRAHMRVARQGGITAASTPAITVPVHVHVIHDGAVGNVPDGDIQQQFVVLNNCYAPHGITFTPASLNRVDNPVWHNMTMNSAAERQAKTVLGRDQESALNFYLAGIGAGLLGWATFPSDLSHDPVKDGVVILFSTLPGGTTPKYNLGATATHEIGHWLGLYHTFQDGCAEPGDEVDDTPFEASPNFGPANPGRNTCPNQPGNDPTTNFMDYTDDAGMNEFTPGQIDRIKEQVSLYRPALVAGGSMRVAPLAIDFVTGVF